MDITKLDKNDPIKLLQKMTKSYELKFSDDFCINWIKNVQSAVKNHKEVLPLGENDNGVFFDIFIDFHNGAFDREDFALLDAKLKEFCIVCGKIESLTDRWPILEQEPSDEDKDKLHNLLGIFFSILPSREVLDEWIKTSIKKLPGSKY